MRVYLFKSIFWLLALMMLLNLNPGICQNQPWIISTKFGFIFETPGFMKESPMNNAGYEEYMSNPHYYSCFVDDFGTIFMVMDMNVKKFDPQSSLYGAVNNMVASFKGNSLNITYSKHFNFGVNQECNGSFIRSGKKYSVRGLSYFNSKQKAFTLITIGPMGKETTSFSTKIFNSVKIADK